MPQLLKHAEVVAHSEVFNDLPVLQSKAVNVLYPEALAVGRQRGPCRGGMSVNSPR
jgi:hypothetical protein